MPAREPLGTEPRRYSLGSLATTADGNEVAPFDDAEQRLQMLQDACVRDDEDMLRTGERHGLRKNFQLLSAVGFTSCVMGTWEILLASSTLVLMNGGLPGLFWSLVWSYVGQFFVVLSLAEMASMCPTAGGAMHWVVEFAPRSYQSLLSYCAGWLAAIGWQSVVAIDCYIGVGQTVQALIQVGRPLYEPSVWQTTLFVIGIVVLASAFNILLARQLSISEGVFAACHVFAFFPVVISLWVMSDPKQPSSEVFLNFTNYGDRWSSAGLAVLIGQVSNVFVVLGSDGMAHLAEEIEDAGTIVPRAMVWSYCLNAPLTMILTLTYCYNMPSVHRAIGSTMAFVTVFQDSFQNVQFTMALTIVILMLMMMITVSTLASTSRQIYAFARDRGLPFSCHISKVNLHFETPVNAILLTATFTTLMALLLNIGRTAAFNTMVSLSTAALMATQILSVGCIALKRWKGHPLPRARWSLGRSGPVINCLALLYSIWAFWWCFWPSAASYSAASFNWSSILFLALVGLFLAYYFLHARHAIVVMGGGSCFD